jgi:adenylyl-sulfate kinase
MEKYALFIGRWQPFHNGHKHIIQNALDEGKNVLIACRQTPISEFDPYTTEERIEMIQEVYKGHPVKVIAIPDIESINIGRKVGYDVNRYDAPQDIEGISATQIRKMMEEGDESWKEKVPREIAKWIEKPEGQVIWMTGWSGSGKSTIAEELKTMLKNDGRKVKVLDGDEVRECLTSDLGFSKYDRDENIKRISYAAKCIADVGGTAIVAAISPYKKAREDARTMIGPDRFVEVFVKADLDTLLDRDPKGLYKKAIAGKIQNFTGISDPYEDPENPEITIDTGKDDNVNRNAAKILKIL